MTNALLYDDHSSGALDDGPQCHVSNFKKVIFPFSPPRRVHLARQS